MKVRELIERIRKVGGRNITLKDGTEIVLLDLCNRRGEEIGKIKIVNGKEVYRWIFCAIKGNVPNYLTEFKMGYSFQNNEYMIPERKMNEFINHIGVDEYRTISVPGYMFFG